MGQYANRTQGSLVVNDDNIYTFYRMHVNDPIHFATDIRMTIQAIGGGTKDKLLAIDKSTAPYKVVICDKDGVMALLAEGEFEPAMDSPEGWYNFYRLDAFRSTVYLYIKAKA